MTMNTQPRLPAGSRAAGSPAGGQYTTKPVPDINSDPVRFNIDPVRMPEPSSWTERTARVRWGRVTFTRTVDEDGAVTISTGCDPADMLLLTKKGDPRYWNDTNWVNDLSTRKMWCADITAQMLSEGLVDVAYTGTEGGVENQSGGVSTAMNAVSSNQRFIASGPHVLTGMVAPIRGLRLLQSMAPDDGWRTRLGGINIPTETRMLLYCCYVNAAREYSTLPKPPWYDGVAWKVQTVAGHAVNGWGDRCFVGEHGDLVWRALTETDRYGRSPLKEALVRGVADNNLAVAAALYDETAAEQLTTNLFVGATTRGRHSLHEQTLAAFTEALNPPSFEFRWTDEQMARIAGFIKTVEALQP